MKRNCNEDDESSKKNRVKTIERLILAVRNFFSMIMALLKIGEGMFHMQVGRLVAARKHEMDESISNSSSLESLSYKGINPSYLPHVEKPDRLRSLAVLGNQFRRRIILNLKLSQLKLH